MTKPHHRETDREGLWRTVRYALESNPRTARFCAIIAVLAASGEATWWLTHI